MCLSPFKTERVFKDHLKYCKLYGNQRVEMPAGSKATLQFKNFQNSLLQIDKAALNCEARLLEVSDPSRPNIVKEHKLVTYSNAHARRDSNNKMQLEEFFATMDEKGSMEKLLVRLIKTANKSFSQLRHTKYPVSLSDKEQRALEKRKVCWVCRSTLA
jgi:hypothetical protein